VKAEEAATAAMEQWVENGKKGPKPDIHKIKKSIIRYPAAKPGTSRHESGFALDTNWTDLTKTQQKKLLGIMESEGFEQLKNDVIHFEKDPLSAGYKSRYEAIKKNRESFNAFKEGEKKGLVDLRPND